MGTPTDFVICLFDVLPFFHRFRCSRLFRSSKTLQNQVYPGNCGGFSVLMVVLPIRHWLNSCQWMFCLDFHANILSEISVATCDLLCIIMHFDVMWFQSFWVIVNANRDFSECIPQQIEALVVKCFLFCAHITRCLLMCLTVLFISVWFTIISMCESFMVICLVIVRYGLYILYIFVYMQQNPVAKTDSSESRIQHRSWALPGI